MRGAEYDELKATVNQYSKYFKKVTFAKPLCDSDSDKKAVAQAIYGAASKQAGFDTVDAAKASTDTAFVFMGHGTSHEARALYDDMQDVVKDLGYSNAFIGTVEGNPEDTSLESVMAEVKKAGYTKVILRPLMVVAGDHANNDMAGSDEDSWKSTFEKNGFTVETQIEGLGQIKAIQDLYVAHTKTALKAAGIKDPSSAIKAVKKTPSVKSVKAGKKKAAVRISKKSGVTGYQIQYSTSKSMKKAKTVKTAKTSKTVKKLKSGKKYYFRVRTYAKVNGDVYYSKWSRIRKSAKIK
jgi:sirohydrochlorin cobaltochelatase